MHAGSAYSLKEFLLWTRRSIYTLLIIGSIPTILYQVFELHWIALPWAVVALLGTATAFIVGFKNTQTYSRTWEARQIWGAILNTSRSWGTMCRDMILDQPDISRTLIYRHFAWLTALRYQMREPRPWENNGKPQNKEYRRFYTIPEWETTVETELSRYLSANELTYILGTKNKAVQIMALQSATLKELFVQNKIDSVQYVALQQLVQSFYDNQGKSERIKNFPYPRQFATINGFFIKLFCFLLPFGMLRDFDKLNESVEGILKGHMVWFVIPFSMLISWVFTSLEQVGESTENPFEGGANDVPISQMSRTIEIDLREMLGEKDLPPALQPHHNIIL
jgi:ion channel-forming bestrophin family protein